MTDDDVLAWLADSDPSLRWKVERDLLEAPEERWRATRARVPFEGFGARLLAAQGDDGLWAGGAHFPAGFTGDEPQPWTATSWSLMSLREWGVDAEALRPDTAGLLARNARWEYDDLPFWDGEVDACINAFTLASGAWLGADVSGIRNWFVEHQLGDGGWNCEWVEGSMRSSFHSTLNAVIGILDDERRTGGTRTCTRRAGAPRSICSSASCSTGCPPASGTRGRITWATRSASATARSAPSITSGRRRSSTEPRPTRVSPTPSSACGHPAMLTAPGIRRIHPRGANGSRSMSRRASPRAG